MYSASESGSNNTGFSSHASISWARRSIVLISPYPSSIIQRNKVILDCRYSMIGSLPSRIVQPPADRSALASDSSKACSHLRFGKPSISRIRPEKIFFLPSFSTVRSSDCIAA